MEVPASAGLQGIEDRLGIVEYRQHDHQHTGDALDDVADALHAAHTGQVDVHENHMGQHGRQFLDGLLGIGAGRHTGDPGHTRKRFFE